jgi:hypothetical protein
LTIELEDKSNLSYFKWSSQELVFEKDPKLDLNQKLTIIWSHNGTSLPITVKIISQAEIGNKCITYKFETLESNHFLEALYKWSETPKNKRNSISEIIKNCFDGVEPRAENPNQQMQQKVQQAKKSLSVNIYLVLIVSVAVFVLFSFFSKIFTDEKTGSVYKLKVINVEQYTCNFEKFNCSKSQSNNSISYFFEDQRAITVSDDHKQCLSNVQFELINMKNEKSSIMADISFYQDRINTLEKENKEFKSHNLTVEVRKNNNLLLEYRQRIFSLKKKIIDPNVMQLQITKCNTQLNDYYNTLYVGGSIDGQCLVIFIDGQENKMRNTTYPKNINSELGTLTHIDLTPELNRVILPYSSNKPFVYIASDCDNIKEYETIEVKW